MVEKVKERKPTPAQRRALEYIAAGHDGYFDTPAWKNCVVHGWLERCDTTQVLSQSPYVAFTLYRCRLTEAGKKVLGD